MSKVTLDKLAAVYLKIRERRSALKRAFDAEDGELKAEQEQLSAAMLELCKAQGIEKSVNTGVGTIIRSVKRKFWTSDWEEFYKFIVDNNAPELLTRSIHQSNMKQFLEDNPDKYPDGLDIQAEESISVRKPTKKAA